MTLDSEYKRDMGKGLNPQIPENYYPDDDPGEQTGSYMESTREQSVYELAELLRISGNPPYDLYGTPF